MPKALPTIDALRAFLRAWYLHSRFEGRDGPVWGADYSGEIVRSAMEYLQIHGHAFIGRYESRTANPIKFDAGLNILNADVPPTETHRVAPSIGRIIHGQAW